MAKVTIIVMDGDEPGGVRVSVEFDPPGEAGEDATLAQNSAIRMLDAIGFGTDDIVQEEE